MTRTEAPVDDWLPGLSSSPDRRAWLSGRQEMVLWIHGRSWAGFSAKVQNEMPKRDSKKSSSILQLRKHDANHFCWTIQVDKAKTSLFYAGKIG